MSQTIKLKRSSIPGAKPLVGQLELGEIAINTSDGKVFAKINDGTEQVIEIAGKYFPTRLDDITAVDGVATYNLTKNASPFEASLAEAMLVSVNGVTQEPIESYTVSGSTITFIPALSSTDVVDYIVDLGKALDVLGSLDYLQINTAVVIDPVLPGQIAWNPDEETINVGLNNDVTLQVGQETLIHVKAAETLSDGDVVYASGAVGNSGSIEVSKYIANNTIDERFVVGIATQDIAVGEFGFVAAFGKVRGISTDGSALTTPEVWTDGTVLYASSAVPGELTSVQPEAPNQDIPIAFVLTASAGNGTLFVRAYELGYHLNEIHDVFAPSPSPGDALVWNQTNERWENTQITESLISDFGTNAITITNTTTSSSTTTGALTVAGGVGIAENLNVGGEFINNVPAGASNPQIYKAQDDTGGVALAQNRARGTLDVPTALIDGDIVGGLNGRAHDGTNYHTTASIRYKIDGTVSTGVVPQKIVFETSETNFSGLTERLTIKPNGEIDITSGDLSVLNMRAPTGGAYFQLFSDSLGHINFKKTDDTLLSQIRALSTDESLRFKTGGGTVDGLTDRLVIDSAGDVVINESLTVTGDLTVSGTTTTVNTTNLDVQDAVITLNKNQVTPLNDIGILMQRYAAADATNYNVAIAWEEGTDRLIIGKTPEDGSDNDISFNTEWMTIKDDGKVGIGTPDPEAPLHIENTSGTSAEMYIAQQKTFGIGEGTAERAKLILSIKEASKFASQRAFAEFSAGTIDEQSSDDGFLDIGVRGLGAINNVMRLTHEGNVDIGGTGSPIARLSVTDTTPDATYGIANFTAGSGVDGYVTLSRGGADSGGYKILRGSVTDSAWYVNNAETTIFRYNGGDTGDSFIIARGSAEATTMSLDNDGNVGIGSSPLGRLSAVSPSGTAGNIAVFGIDAISNGFQIIQTALNEVSYEFHNGSNNEVMVIDSSGNVGIGSDIKTNTGSYKAIELGASLYLGGISASEGAVLGSNYYVGAGAVNTYKTTAAASQYLQIGGEHIWYNAPSGTADTVATFTERMRIDASGNVGIGDNNPDFKLCVTSNIDPATTSPFDNTSSMLRLENTNTSANSYTTITFSGADDTGVGRHAASISMLKNGTWTAGSGNYSGSLIFSTRPTSGNQVERMRIDSSGNVGIGTDSPITALDVNGDLRSVSKRGSEVYLAANLNWVRVYYREFVSSSFNYGSQYLDILMQGATGGQNSGARIFIGNKQQSTGKYPSTQWIESFGSHTMSVAEYYNPTGGTGGFGTYEVWVKPPLQYMTVAVHGEAVSITGSESAGDIVLSNTGSATQPTGSTLLTPTITVKDGSVGIGTVLPSSVLHIERGDSTAVADTLASRTTDSRLFIRNSDTTIGNSAGITLNTAAGSNNYWFIDAVGTTSYGAPLTFSNRTGSTTVAERMRIDSNGNVGIGVSPASGTKLQVNDGTNKNLAVRASTNLTDGMTLLAMNDAGLTTQPLELFGTEVSLRGGSAEGLRVNSSGNVEFKHGVQEQQYNLTGTDINPANGTIQYVTLTGNVTLTESLADGQYVTLMIDDGTGFTITWPTITWVGGTAPTLVTTGYNVIELWQVNSTLYGAFVGAA